MARTLYYTCGQHRRVHRPGKVEHDTHFVFLTYTVRGHAP
jgi:hypothetical protein